MFSNFVNPEELHANRWVVIVMLKKSASRSRIRMSLFMGANQKLKKMLEEEVEKRRRLERKLMKVEAAVEEERKRKEEEQKEPNHVVLLLYCIFLVVRGNDKIKNIQFVYIQLYVFVHL